METEPDIESSLVETPAAPRKVKRKRFVESWLDEPAFVSWLQRCEGNPHKAVCSACNKTLNVGRKDLLKHSETKTHLESTITKESLENDYGAALIAPSSKRAIKTAEIRYALDVVEHSRSFYSFERDDAREMTLRRSKISAIIKNVLNKSVVLRTAELLRSKRFFVLVDEFVDVSQGKNLCVLARYFHDGKTRTYLLDYVKATDGNLYDCFGLVFERHDVPLSNVIGFCSDNANINSLLSRLSKDKEEATVFPCTRYDLHRIAIQACETLPDSLDDLLHAVYTYVARNEQREELEEIQSCMRNARQNARESSNGKTRWLTNSRCIEKLLQRWLKLRKFFAFEAIECPSNDASEIFNRLDCLYTKAYMQFLNYSLKIVDEFNESFECSKVSSADIHALLWQIGGNFIKRDALENSNVRDIDAFDEENLLDFEAMFLSEQTRRTVREIKENQTDDRRHEKVVEFYETCRKFYQTFYEAAVKRLPLNDSFVKSLEFVNPHVTLDIAKHEDQLELVTRKFASKCDVDADEACNEWYKLAFLPQNLREALAKLDAAEFWHAVGRMEKYSFKNITTLATICLSLPRSNADIERFFRMVNEVKTQDRNRLKTGMVAAICRVKLELRNTNTNCYDYPVTDDMFELFNKSMYSIS